MAYTNIYDKILHTPFKITWRDLFSDSMKRYSKQDMEYAMIAGTSLDSATKSNMLQKWRKPWLFGRILAGGIAVSLIIYIVVYACIQLFSVSGIAALNLLFVVFPPIIVPFALMIFFWELNIPRNISIYQLLGYFMIGGMLSILATLVVAVVAPQGGAAWAPFSEEPGKLLVVLLLIKLFHFNKSSRVYGITGMVIGAAVGAGFGGFESAQYAYNVVDWVQVGGFYIWQEAFEAIVMNEALRGVFAVCGHTLYCAPYAAAVALHMEGKRITKRSILNRDFYITFACSVLAHAVWNIQWGSDNSLLMPKMVITTAILWMSARHILRKCFAQLAMAAASDPRDNLLPDMRLECISGTFVNRAFGIKNAQVFLGTDANCNLCFPMGTTGVNEKHCEILVRNGHMYLADLGSAYGTYLNGKRLPPGKGYLLKAGDVFYLGSQKESFRIRKN